MSERVLIHVEATQADLLLSGWELVFKDSLRIDLEPKHREYVNDTLNQIATKCVDVGLGYELAQRKVKLLAEDKLEKLRDAYQNGEMEL